MDEWRQSQKSSVKQIRVRIYYRSTHGDFTSSMRVRIWSNERMPNVKCLGETVIERRLAVWSEKNRRGVRRDKKCNKQQTPTRPALRSGLEERTEEHPPIFGIVA